jgi:hypothetical protein
MKSFDVKIIHLCPSWNILYLYLKQINTNLLNLILLYVVFFLFFLAGGWGYFILFFSLVCLFVLFQFILKTLAHNLYWFKFALTWRDLCKVSVKYQLFTIPLSLSLSLSLTDTHTHNNSRLLVRVVDIAIFSSNTFQYFFSWLVSCVKYILLHGILHIIPFISLGRDISPRADRLKGWYMNEGWKRVWFEKWHIVICLSYTPTEEVTDLYQNA